MRLAKPIVELRGSRNLRRERRRWDDPDLHNLPLGCIQCADRGLCGGIHKRQLDYDCLGDCCGYTTASYFERAFTGSLTFSTLAISTLRT